MTLRNYPIHTLIAALQHVEHFDDVLDMGGGDLHDSFYLKEIGFKNVTAIDARVPEKKEGINFIQTRIEDFNFGSYDLINAQYVLHALEPSIFETIKGTLKPGGVLVGNVFRYENEFPLEARKYSKEALLQCLNSLTILYMAEVDETHEDMSSKMRDWHTYDFIAKKPLNK